MMIMASHNRLPVPVRGMLLLLAFIAGFAIQNAYAAAATCLAGLPCLVNATPNNPANAADGPNAGSAPNAAKTPGPSSGCDADFMNEIYSRAWLGSQRERIESQIVIRKPDSILQYTCFNQFGDNEANTIVKSFSESTKWRNVIIPINGTINYSSVGSVRLDVYMGPNRLANSLNLLVEKGITGYLKNFNHRYLGDAAVSAAYTERSGAGGYDCIDMDLVYELAKCSNIITDDRFPAFSELISPDPRDKPAFLKCTGTDVTQGRIDLSENKDLKYVNFSAISPANNLLKPGAPCADPIPTGLTYMNQERSVAGGSGNVTVTSTNSYPDMICPNPDCFYCPASKICTAGNCEATP